MEKDNEKIAEEILAPTTVEQGELTATGEVRRDPPAKQGRIIVRNLIFDMREKHLQKSFGKFGKITNIEVPLNNTNNQNRGFGFIEFSGKGEAQAAITAMNASTFKGRPITVEFSIQKQSYETKVQHVLDNTNLTKQDAIKPKSVKADEKQKAADDEAKKAAEIPKPDKPKKAPHVKDTDDQTTSETLFVRNIAWDVSQIMFRDHMEQFGELHYAVLCKAAGDMKVEQLESKMTQTHKGTGFVRFKNLADAKAVVSLSQSLEAQLDVEHREKNKKPVKGQKANVKENLIGQTSLLKGELELNGRRLVILPSVARTNVADTVQNNKDTAKDKGEDRRNLYLKKEGLLSEKDWIHQQPQLSGKDLEARQALYIAKDKALKQSPNLSVSKVRLQVRNLPKKDFYEPELRALMINVMEQYKSANSEIKINAKKLIVQNKVLRDSEKTVQVDTKTTDLKAENLGTSFKQGSGLAFVELAYPDAALFAVRYLNNMQLTGRGLVVDFCLQDARKMHHRTQKLEKHQRIAMEKKDADKKARRDVRRAGTTVVPQTVELGKRSNKTEQKAAPQKATISSISDVGKLAQMKQESISRGQKQRINKQIAELQGTTEEIAKVKKQVKDSRNKKSDAKVKVDILLKKRDEKIAEKIESKKPKYTEADKKVMKEQKQHKRDKQRARASTEEDFDHLYKQYEKRLIKKLDKNPGEEDKGGHAFKEIEISD